MKPSLLRASYRALLETTFAKFLENPTSDRAFALYRAALNYKEVKDGSKK